MTKSSPLLDLLDNAGLFVDERIDERRVVRMSAGRLSDLGGQAAELTRVNAAPPEPGALAHSATLSLGGGAEPCASVECRMKHIDQLVPFAALYSDRVYVHNFLSDHEHTPHAGFVPSLQDRRFTLLNDLRIIQRVRPLIEAGLLVPVTAIGNRCPHCVALGAFGAGADSRLEKEYRRLSREFFEKMSVTLEYHAGIWAISCEVPDNMLEHGSSYVSYREPPEPLRQMPQLLNRAKAGEVVALSVMARRKLGAHKDAAGDVLESVAFEMAVAQVLGTSYLSDTPLPLEVLSAVSGDPDLARRSSVAQRHLTSVVPFLGDVPAREVIKLRQREGESFQQYRKALNKAIDEVRLQKTAFSERDARAIYSDVVAPGLAGLDRAIKNARRDVLREVGRSVFAWTGAISFGMYLGFVPDQLQLAAKTLGATKVLADLGSAAAKLVSPDDAIRREDFYFLWRVRRLSRRR